MKTKDKKVLFNIIKRTWIPYIYLLLLIGLMIINPIVTIIPMVFAQETAVEKAGPTTVPVSKAQPILLSIQYGKGGQVQEYPISSGEAVFVPAGEPNNPSINVNPQEAKESDAYRQQMGVLSEQIAQKISLIQKKQQDVNNEVYPVYKTPLQIEVNNLQNDLTVLQARKEQLSAQRTAKEASKPTVPPTPPTKVASGFTVTPIIASGKAKITVQTQGKNQTQTTIEAAPDVWVQIFSAEKGQSQDIWAKVSPRQ